MASEVHSITTVQESRHNDISLRKRNYIISMSIRVVCLLAAFLVDGWMRWAMIAAAAVLPYFAVLFANAGAKTKSYDAAYHDEHQPILTQAPSEDLIR